LTVLMGFDDDKYAINDNARGLLFPVLLVMVVSALVEVLMMWIDVLSRANSMRMRAKIEGPAQKWCGVCTIGKHTKFTVVKRCAHAFILSMGIGVGVATFWFGLWYQTSLCAAFVLLILAGVVASAGNQMRILVLQGSETSGSSPLTMAKQITDVKRRLVGSAMLMTFSLGVYAVLKRRYVTEPASFIAVEVGLFSTNGLVLTLVWYVRLGAMRALNSMGYGPNGSSPHVRLLRAFSSTLGAISLTSPRQTRGATDVKFGTPTGNPIRDSSSSEISDM